VIFICLMLFVPVRQALSIPVYTLNQVCQLADKHARTIHIADQDLFIARQDKQRALSVLIPRVTLFGNYMGYRNSDITSPDSLTMGAKLTQSFTLNGRELIAYDVSKKGIETASFSRAAIRSAYLFQVAQTFFQALSAKRMVEIAQADMDRLAAHKTSVREQLKVGSVTRTALYRAKAELSKSRTSKIMAENQVGQTKAALVNLAGIPDEFEINARDHQAIDHFVITRDEIRAKALKNRYEIRKARKDLEIATRTIAYEKGDYWPVLSLEGGYKETDFSYKSLGSTIDYDSENAYVKAELAFTLYDGGLRKAQVLQAKARRAKARQALAMEEEKIAMESRVAFLEYETARHALDNLQDELASARENYEAVKMQFKYGMADSIDMMDANTLLVQAERRISDARYTYYLSVLKILYTQGDLLSFLLKDS
jgi:outer membrane protein